MQYTIDCSAITDRKEFHRVLAETLSFPDCYGHNLDALYDYLTSISTETHLILKKWDTLPPIFKGFQTVLNDAENDNPYLTVTFIEQTRCE